MGMSTGVSLLRTAQSFLTGRTITILAAIAPTYSIHTDVMSEVVLENTLDIKCIFQTSRFIKLILLLESIYFFFNLIIKL